MSLMKRWAILLSGGKWQTATEEQQDAWLWFIGKLTTLSVRTASLVILITIGALIVVS